MDCLHDTLVKVFWTSVILFVVGMIWVKLIDDTDRFAHEHGWAAILVVALVLSGFGGMIVSALGMIWL